MLSPRVRLFVVLATVFVTCLTVGDIIGGKLIETQLLGQSFIVTVGMIPFPVTFLLTDVLNEFYGKRAARFVTVVGFMMAVLAYAFIYIAVVIPIAPLTQAPDFTGVRSAAFDNVFAGSRRMILASMVAYITAQLVDIFVFHALKRVTANKLLWLRATGSTVVSQFIDTVVINSVAWVGILEADQIMRVVFSAYSLKILIAIGLTPLIYLAHSVVQRGFGIEPVLLDAQGEPMLAPEAAKAE
ncbi:MAG TPA: queuosine precursor transporter [Polyangiaceae bacterium]|nr:queuosine precursor transporter [Polyangiaceae bacterium]